MAETITKKSPKSAFVGLPNCCQLTQQALIFNGPPTKDQLRSVGQALCRIDKGNFWWWGDYLNAMIAQYLTADQDQPETTRTMANDAPGIIVQRSMHYVRRFAENADLEPNTLWIRKWICSFYPPEHRHPLLTPTHHILAVPLLTGHDNRFLVVR